MDWVARTLQQAGCRVATYGVPQWTDFDSPARAVEGADGVVLPVVPDGTLPLPDGALPLTDLWPMLRPGTLVFGGKLPAAFPGRLRAMDYCASETVAVQNAVPTSEGAIQIAMERLPVTLHGSPVLVIGFGRIGKVLARQLRGLGAKVTVAARKAADRALAEAMGYRSDETGVYGSGLDYVCIFNTVPAPVLSGAQLVRTGPDCLLLDLASGAGGVDFDACRTLGRQSIHALSLPGKAAPAAAGEIIGKFVLNAL